MTDLLGHLGGALSDACGINDIGQVAGVETANGVRHAFLYSGGTMSDLGTLGGTGLGWESPRWESILAGRLSAGPPRPLVAAGAIHSSTATEQ